MNNTLLSYRPRLDGLRFLAISFVLVEHFGGYLAGHIAGGYYGVDLFFVISGYLITGILLRDTGHTFGASYRVFVGRRALRIFPAYYLLIAVLTLINYFPARELFPWLATYTFNYPAARWEAVKTENPLYYLWSLSVEEQFYLFWPPLVIALRRRKKILFVVTAAIVMLGWAQAHAGLIDSLVIYNYTGTFNRMGSLGLGALGAVYVEERSGIGSWSDSLWLELVALAALCAALMWAFPYRYLIMAPCSLVLVLKAAHGGFRIKPVEWLVTRRPILYIGSISYGIYLFHVPLAALFGRYVFDPVWNSIPFSQFGVLAKAEWHPWVFKLPLNVAIAIGAASLSYRWFEAPILRYKDKWFAYRGTSG